jgi:hypothetical protein
MSAVRSVTALIDSMGLGSSVTAHSFAKDCSSMAEEHYDYLMRQIVRILVRQASPNF